MKTILLTSLLLLVLASCNPTYYYACEDKEGYYTFEVNKKKVIYRASSLRYNNTIPQNRFIYIYMNSFESEERSGVTRFYFNPARLRTLYPLAREEYGINIVDNIGTAYASSNGSHGIKYIGDKETVQMSGGPKDVHFRFGNGEVKVTWMPYQLKRVKKINYEKLESAGIITGFDFENP